MNRKKPKPPKPPLPAITRQVAHSQAKAFAAVAENIGKGIIVPTDAGLVMAYLVNAGFAVELYFKTFMIAARKGQIIEGHSLADLLKDFPQPLKQSFNELYAANEAAKTMNVRLLAIAIDNNSPPDYKHTGRYNTFEEAISAIATIFVDARYFFENVRGKDHAIVAYPTDAISAIFRALETTYQKLQAGDFTGKF